ELAELYAGGLVEPNPDCSVGPDGGDRDLLQCIGWLWRERPQSGIQVAPDSPACYLHRILPHRGYRQPARRPHSRESAKSSQPLSIPTRAVMESLTAIPRHDRPRGPKGTR